MCLCIDKRHPNLIEAKRSITVYKLLYRDEDGSYKSVVQDFLYEPYQIVKSLIKVRSYFCDQSQGGYVTTGLHAYRSLKHAMDSYLWNAQGNNVIVKMIIPKGAHYYIGTNGDIVSDTLDTADMTVTANGLGTISAC